MLTGFSLYMNTGIEKNKEIINKGKKYGCKYVFSSLNIQEEELDKKTEMEKIIDLCIKNNLNLILDINKESSKYLIENPHIYYRIDDGFSLDEIISFSKKNKIVLNSSVLNEKNLQYFKEQNINFSNILSLHNFYPKKFTGISIDYLREQNIKYSQYGIKNMAFVMGDILRGPTYQGLPTVEEHRNKNILISSLELIKNFTDVVLIGDIDLTDENWTLFHYLQKDIIPIKIKDNILLNFTFENRPDFSQYVVRNLTHNRNEFKNFIEDNIKDCKLLKNQFILKGDILITNDEYNRYSGELEIALKDLGYDNGRDIISKVSEDNIELLQYLSTMRKFTFINI